LLGQHLGQPVSGGSVASVDFGAGPQYRDGLLDAALLDQQPGQPVGGGLEAGVDTGP
jgi:hypothetical protein